MERKQLKELNLLDDFLFNAIVTHPSIGELFIREFLRIIFQREFGRLVITPQKIYYGSNTDHHGARLDVYLEESSEAFPGGASIYDLEPDQSTGAKRISALPRRTRFYHAKIDAASLRAGESYHHLKTVIVILITPYDPFGLGRMVYTIQNSCLEEPNMPYDDGAYTLYLYTKGTKGNPPEALRELLCYMESTCKQNARTEALQNIHRMVEYVKNDREVSLSYMKIFEREEMLIEQGKEMERENTERERLRADQAERELAKLLEKLKGMEIR